MQEFLHQLLLKVILVIKVARSAFTDLAWKSVPLMILLARTSASVNTSAAIVCALTPSTVAQGNPVVLSETIKVGSIAYYRLGLCGS